MVKKILLFVLFMPIFSATVITDSFLHQGNSIDSVVFYSDVPVKTHLQVSEQKDGMDRAVVRLAKTRVTRSPVLAHLNKKVTSGYQFSCIQSGHDIVCTFTYAHDAMTVSIDQLKNWHNIPTTIIFCKRRVVPDKPVFQKPVIAIDCGHGGDQPGAIGLFGIVEKDITLTLGKQLSNCLKQRGYEVLLTRDGDYGVLLDERTSFANRQHASLLISLHCNYAQTKDARGIETLYSTLRSRPLADFIHEQLTTMPIKGIVDRGVKFGMLQTTFGCECPAVLIELFFLSNFDDVRVLKDHAAHEIIIASLCAAIDQFILLRQKTPRLLSLGMNGSYLALAE